ncbi:gamma-glutamylcyclotransferase family protein [Archaeoglobus profundus]|uniref:AIG2 family protein n=1 Tax=Archaeoglobus profundus (strain DSM 5631 / JCM 9629 / NBRC 100127 / Av18) TaxID=572546 RepID=D2RGD8_ARCPA|nr:gamma-glutamylcyclotransferase family protein [Archaeoglobus profundus]ADB57363.1 AIG2 family protein [Archaeoglobus profundus DSM 5631]
MLLFVYGTLMDIEKASKILKRRVKTAKKAFLPNYRIAFNVPSLYGTGNPNIEEGGDGVWGVVYEVDEKTLELLDKVSPRYERIEVEVIVDGKPVKAWTYVGKTKAEVKPDKSCVERVIRGARTHGLPEDYVKMLEGFLNEGDG